MVLVDLPRRTESAAYEEALGRLTRRLAAHPGIRAVWQVGSVSAPGISDLDVVAVFEPDASYPEDPLKDLPPIDRYVFVHAPYAVTTEHWDEAARLTFFHNYRLLWGAGDMGKLEPLPAEARAQLQRQVALEYLAQIFVSLSVEQTYGIVKVRNLFLHAKAMLYDCEFLGIERGPFRDAVDGLVRLRMDWFVNRPSLASVRAGILTLHRELGRQLADSLSQAAMYLPARPDHRLARHVRLVSDAKFEVKHSGWVLPALLGRLGRRYFNAQHRLNRFEFHLPFRTDTPPEVIANAFELRKRMQTINRARFPRFMTLASSLNVA